MINDRQKKRFAVAGLSGVLVLPIFVVVTTFFFWPDQRWPLHESYQQLRVKWMGGEYMGIEGVVLQDKYNNCGPAALKMVFDRYGIPSTVAEIEQNIGLAPDGSTMLALKVTAELKGLQTEGWRYSLNDLLRAPKPLIVFVNGDHFAVVDSVTASHEILMRDPALGKLKIPVKNLQKIWNGETLVFYGHFSTTEDVKVKRQSKIR